MRWKDVEEKNIQDADGSVGLAFDGLEIIACRSLGPTRAVKSRNNNNKETVYY